jgi:hypothetical protein
MDFGTITWYVVLWAVAVLAAIKSLDLLHRWEGK